MEFAYPAIFHPNQDGSYTITFPDLPGCVSEGKSLTNALYMAQAALTQWIGYLSDEDETFAAPSSIGGVKSDPGEFINLIRAEVRDNRAVRRTVSIPKWMDDMVSEFGLSLSRVLQDALREKLQLN